MQYAQQKVIPETIYDIVFTNVLSEHRKTKKNVYLDFDKVEDMIRRATGLYPFFDLCKINNALKDLHLNAKYHREVIDEFTDCEFITITFAD